MCKEGTDTIKEYRNALIESLACLFHDKADELFCIELWRSDYEATEVIQDQRSSLSMAIASEELS